jgi:hypothetical protein
MITKAEVIELFQTNKAESEQLLQLMIDVDTDNLEFHKNLELIQSHIALIDIIIMRIDQEPTQEDLKHFFNIALSWGIDSN